MDEKRNVIKVSNPVKDNGGRHTDKKYNELLSNPKNEANHTWRQMRAKNGRVNIEKSCDWFQQKEEKMSDISSRNPAYSHEWKKTSAKTSVLTVNPESSNIMQFSADFPDGLAYNLQCGNQFGVEQFV